MSVQQEKAHQSPVVDVGKALLAWNPNPVLTPTLPRNAAAVIAERAIVFLSSRNNCVYKWWVEIWIWRKMQGQFGNDWIFKALCIEYSLKNFYLKHCLQYGNTFPGPLAINSQYKNSYFNNNANRICFSSEKVKVKPTTMKHNLRCDLTRGNILAVYCNVIFREGCQIKIKNNMIMAVRTDSKTCIETWFTRRAQLNYGVWILWEL